MRLCIPLDMLHVAEDKFVTSLQAIRCSGTSTVDRFDASRQAGGGFFCDAHDEARRHPRLSLLAFSAILVAKVM